MTRNLNREMNLAALAAASRGDLVNALIPSTPGGIERQEAAGQRTLLESAMLPKEISGATREELTALGFKFGADVDELFVTCELPPGWAKSGTKDAMHSDLLDDQGRKRAGIFYKAAFYDRRADMHMNRRYGVESWRDGSSDKALCVYATDCGQVIKEFGEAGLTDWAAIDALETKAVAWLTATYPAWESPLACW
jgi:hypothetical protein